MKGQLILFRILTFILVPIAIFFAFMVLVMLIMAPGALIPIFLFGSFVIYVITSLIFLTKGIDRNAMLKPSLRDWIRVNAFVTIAMGVLSLYQSLNIFMQPAEDLRKQVEEMMSAQSAAGMPGLNANFYTSALHIAAGFMAVMAVLTLVHLFLNFRIMKRYRYLFGGESTEE